MALPCIVPLADAWYYHVSAIQARDYPVANSAL